VNEEDAIFPGEEVKPEQAFHLAENKMVNSPRQPVFIELADDVRWDSVWGQLD
jgi:hypothetical protein